MDSSPNDAVEEFTRDSVRDVFRKMLSLEVQNDEPLPLSPDSAGQIAGSVSFIGKATGVVYLNAGANLAKFITCQMLGMTEAEVDDEMVNDAYGELCNMVVGAVKSRLCDRGWPCVLTIPSILRGNVLQIQDTADVKRTMVGFRIAEHRLIVDIAVKNLEA